MAPIHVWFAPCPRGLESHLAQELAPLGAARIQAAEGGVAFTGDFTVCYGVNLWSRIASRVLLRLAEGPYRGPDDIYRLAHRFPWPDLFQVTRTIKVDTTGVRSPLRSLDFVTLRVKDAICDRFRTEGGSRPSVDAREPDVRVYVFLTSRQATLYLDTSGESLFKRGYRQATVEAPLRENLAAGILAVAGWTPGQPFLDPMCGGGTFLVEAAWKALNIAPGGDRWFAFEKLRIFDRTVWDALYADAQESEARRVPLPIFGRDVDPTAIRASRVNLEAAGLEGVVDLARADIREGAAPPAPGVMVTNPPYGERLQDQETLAAFYPELGHALKSRYSGWRVHILTADTRLPRLMRLDPNRRTPLFNGALECRLFAFQMVPGSNRKRD